MLNDYPSCPKCHKKMIPQYEYKCRSCGVVLPASQGEDVIRALCPNSDCKSRSFQNELGGEFDKVNVLISYACNQCRIEITPDSYHQNTPDL